MVAMRDIEAFSRRIGETFRPRRVVLFGSYATGKAGPDSDVDLLVELPHGGGCKAAASIIRSITPRFGVDLIVRSERDVAWRLKQNDSFLEAIFRDGRVLYEAAD